MPCKFLLPVFFLSAFLLVPQTVEAQGRYSCVWITTNPMNLTGSGACIDGPITTCSSGYYRPANGCSRHNNAGPCTAGGECISSGSGGNGGPSLTGCPSGGQGIETALGCIPIQNITESIKWFLRWAIGIAGGIAFLLILSSGFQIMTSSGNPEKLKGGQEQLTAAISGLLLIIFSVFLLRLIGVDILKLPGFGS